MINLVIVGSIGLDDIKTPFGKISSTLGGSAVYSALSASFFEKPGVVGIVGRDMPQEELKALKNIDLSGISKGEKTFRWEGKYEYDMNEAKTLKTELNCLSNFNPRLPNSYKNAKYLLLANIDPDSQIKALNQLKNEPFVILDSMNFWIKNKKEKLVSAIKKSDLVLLNDGEARQLFNTPNLIKAGRKLLELGPQYAVIKKGEHGALLFSYDSFFSAPGYPLEELKDPTGAGDSFAGGLIGYLAKHNKTDEKTIRQGIIFGSAIASFCAEALSTKALLKIKISDIKERYEVFQKIREF